MRVLYKLILFVAIVAVAALVVAVSRPIITATTTAAAVVPPNPVQAPPSSSQQPTTEWKWWYTLLFVIAGIIVVVVVVLGIVFVVRRRRRATSENDVAPPSSHSGKTSAVDESRDEMKKLLDIVYSEIESIDALGGDDAIVKVDQDVLRALTRDQTNEKYDLVDYPLKWLASGKTTKGEYGRALVDMYWALEFHLTDPRFESE